MLGQYRRGGAIDDVAPDQPRPDLSVPQLTQQRASDRRAAGRKHDPDDGLLQGVHCRNPIRSDYLFLR
jgi:hypothetical protein